MIFMESTKDLAVIHVTAPYRIAKDAAYGLVNRPYLQRGITPEMIDSYSSSILVIQNVLQSCILR